MPARRALAPQLAALVVIAAALATGCDSTVSLPDQGPLRPASLTFSLQPENAVAGQPMVPVAVTVLNSAGDTAFSSTASISLSIEVGTGNPLAHLHGTTQLAAVNGTALFTGLSIDSAGAGFQLLATSSIADAVSDSFNVAHP
jgi:hypothetical protein